MTKAAPEHSDLRIMVRTHTGISQAACVLCGQPSPGARTGAGLYDGGVHLGDICQSCLRGGKRGASQRTRSYLADLRRLAEQGQAATQTTRPDACRDWLYRYADFLEDLAVRLDCMIEWIPIPRPG
jgi:hypothetical protein